MPTTITNSSSSPNDSSGKVPTGAFNTILGRDAVLHDLVHMVGSLGIITDDLRQRLLDSHLPVLRSVLTHVPMPAPAAEVLQGLVTVLDEQQRRQIDDLSIMRLQIRHLRHSLRAALGAEGSARSGSLHEMLTEAVALADLQRPGVAYALTIDPALTWVGDHWTLLLVVVSLLDNAKTAVVGQPEPKIDLHAFLQDQELVLTIDDNGHGWPAEAQAQLGQPGFSRTVGGLGIGLAACRERLKALGGRLSWISPGPGRGASFQIILPFSSSPSVSGGVL